MNRKTKTLIELVLWLAYTIFAAVELYLVPDSDTLGTVFWVIILLLGYLNLRSKWKQL